VAELQIQPGPGSNIFLVALRSSTVLLTHKGSAWYRLFPGSSGAWDFTLLPHLLGEAGEWG